MKITKKRLQEIILEELKEADMLDELTSARHSDPRDRRKPHGAGARANIGQGALEMGSGTSGARSQLARAATQKAMESLKASLEGQQPAVKAKMVAALAADLGVGEEDVSGVASQLRTQVGKHAAETEKENR